MKKLSRKQKEWQKIEIVKIARRKKKRLNKKPLKRSRFTVAKPKIIHLPKNLTFQDGEKETTAFFEQLRSSIAVGRAQPFSLDFSNLERVDPGSALVLASGLDHWRHAHGVKIRVLYHQFKEQPLTLFSELGLFKLLNVVNPIASRKKEKSERMTIEFRTGAELDAESPNNEQAMELEESLLSVAGEFPGREDIFAGLTEAMNNVREHAYPPMPSQPYGDYLVNRWWMTGSYDKRDRKLKIVFFDRGIGISKTIEAKIGTKKMFDLFKRWNSEDSDSSRIRAAVEYGKTKTNKKERGKGLTDIRRVADTAGEAKLSILSGTGRYLYTPLENEHGTESTDTLSNPINGTLILWEIVLPKPVQDNAHHESH